VSPSPPRLRRAFPRRCRAPYSAGTPDTTAGAARPLLGRQATTGAGLTPVGTTLRRERFCHAGASSGVTSIPLRKLGPGWIGPTGPFCVRPSYIRKFVRLTNLNGWIRTNDSGALPLHRLSRPPRRYSGHCQQNGADRNEHEARSTTADAQGGDLPRSDPLFKFMSDIDGSRASDRLVDSEERAGCDQQPACSAKHWFYVK